MSDRYSDWVHVVPAKGEVKSVAKALLSLAPTPAHVRTEANGLEFLVHPNVADAYNGASTAPLVNPFSDDAPPAPPKRRARVKKESDQP